MDAPLADLRMESSEKKTSLNQTEKIHAAFVPAARSCEYEKVDVEMKIRVAKVDADLINRIGKTGAWSGLPSGNVGVSFLRIPAKSDAQRCAMPRHHPLQRSRSCPLKSLSHPCR